MLLPFIMEQAEAMKEAIPVFQAGQPVGDGIGPMVVGKMMLNNEKDLIAFQTVIAKTTFENRELFLLKAEGPASTVGRPADALETIISNHKIDAIIMIDAALKMEGEESASVAQGFGAAIGGIGTEKFKIEAIATSHEIPIFSIVIKQSVKEAITLMTKEIADTSDEVSSQVYEMIKQKYHTRPVCIGYWRGKHFWSSSVMFSKKKNHHSVYSGKMQKMWSSTKKKIRSR